MKKKSLPFGGRSNPWESNAVKFGQICTRHFHKGIGYENSGTDRGYIHQLSLFSVNYTYKLTRRKTYVIIIEMVDQQYEQTKFPACIVVSKVDKTLHFVKRVHHESVPVEAINALSHGGDLHTFVDEDNLIKLPKHIVCVCLHQFDELWR